MRRGWLPLIAIVVLAGASLSAVLVTRSAPQLGLDLAGGFSVTLQPVEEASDDALDQAIEIIRTRVDAIGVGEPEITRQGQTIVVNLPGVTDRERATELVGQTAELRFRPLLCDLGPAMAAVVPAPPTTAEPEPGEVDEPGAAESPDVVDDEEAMTAQSGSGPAVRLQDDEAPEDTDGAADADAPDGEVPLEDDDDDLFLPPVGVGDQVCEAALAGTAEPEDLAVTERDDDAADVAVTLDDPDNRRLRLGPAQMEAADGRTLALTGDILEDANARLDTMTGQWRIDIDIRGGEAAESFNLLAAACFQGTGDCPGAQSAIVLDSEVVTVLGYQEPTFRGTASISGRFTESEAKDLALVLRYGALPVALEIQSTEAVSATLGRDTLRGGLAAGVIGLTLVALYMVAYYRLLGLVAVGSLVISGALLWSVVAWLGETQGLALTLAGIVGIVVSIGVAVDSNVVFYENLKEEVSRGRTLRAAVGGAFDGAWSTIVKADVATLIGAVLLYWLTIGPVRGFAFFLGLATLLDLVASWFFMRPLVLRLGRNRRFQERPRVLGLRTPEVAAP